MLQAVRHGVVRARTLLAFHVSCSSSNRSAAAIPPVPVVHHPLYSAPHLAPNHRFPMQVFGTIYKQLLQQGIISSSQVYHPQSIPTDTELALVHSPSYLAAFSSGRLDEQRVQRIGFGPATHTQILIDRTKAEVAGTLLTAQLALQHGLAVNTAGGTHHAFADYGSGFCILNDLAYTAHWLIQQGDVERVLIVDLDVHQGDGTAAICAGHSGIFTLSVHSSSNFPARKQQSSLDVGLPDGVTDDDYLAAVAQILPDVLSSFQPQLVLYDAGVDIHEDDELGRLSVSDAGLMRRELLVLDTCLAAGVPVAGYVGGGYCRDLNVLAERHMLLHKAALRMWADHNL
eukprot:GHRR01019201.1.p1 GENE.GHRR01019201.1~~GHRR01019201.1.p1  ORF type:complete len:343 (+),score=113.12 GHRR01019201.1:374-1402(+)